MSKREFDYVGFCDDCERTVEREIGVHPNAQPARIEWGRCGTCREILALHKESPETAMTDWETSV